MFEFFRNALFLAIACVLCCSGQKPSIDLLPLPITHLDYKWLADSNINLGIDFNTTSWDQILPGSVTPSGYQLASPLFPQNQTYLQTVRIKNITHPLNHFSMLRTYHWQRVFVWKRFSTWTMWTIRMNVQFSQFSSPNPFTRPLFVFKGRYSKASLYGISYVLEMFRTESQVFTPLLNTKALSRRFQHQSGSPVQAAFNRCLLPRDSHTASSFNHLTTCSPYNILN